MVASVCPTDSWRILARLTRGFKLVCAGSIIGCRVSSHGLEIQSELTDVGRHLTDLGGAGPPSAGGSDAAGVARVPDVGVVGGDRGATGGGGDHTTHSEPGSAGTVGRSCLAGAL